MNSSNTRFVRLGETAREKVRFMINDKPAEGLQGDTLMVAILNNIDHLRQSEFGDGKRSGFCLMGACQDCWVWTSTGAHVRACSTLVSEGIEISTRQPELTWPNLA